MVELHWRNIAEECPKGNQICLTECKHGLIEGIWNSDDQNFSGYYWVDLCWYADKWIPIEEVR